MSNKDGPAAISTKPDLRDRRQQRHHLLDKSLGTQGYVLSYAPYPYSDTAAIGTVDLGDVLSIAYSLPEGVVYYLSVQAYNSFGLGPYSNVELFTSRNQ